jgi:Tfp pilus assembly protein PilX
MRIATARNLGRPQPKRGIAALTIVMLLFFVMAMVAAYANRTLIFEQKISANVYRFTKATEAAEGGIEWAIAQINGGRIDGACVASANGADGSFRQRYVTQDSTGVYSPVTWPKPGAPTPPSLSMSCFKNGTGELTCNCPTGGLAALANPAGLSMAFAVALTTLPPKNPIDGTKKRPGVIKLQVTGCSNFGTECYSPNPVSADAKAIVELDLALLSGLASPPAAALSVTGNVTSTVPITVSNADAGSGITVHSGGNLGTAGGSHFFLPAGVVGDGIIQGDVALQDIGASGKMFLGVFGMPVATYQYQPAVYRLTNCAAAACVPISLATAISNNPGRIIFVSGDLTIDSSAPTLGSADQPVFLVVNGEVNFTGPGVTVNGLIYANGFNWASTATNSTIYGAVIVNGNFSADANANIAYSAAMVKMMNMSYGSLVRIPGSWTNWFN